jgi:hypothetical protein
LAQGRRSYFRCHSAGGDHGELLDPDKQVTEPWGSPDHGRCDKCGGSGAARYECFSCLEGGSAPDCPVCQGRVRFEQTCPACQGSGEIHQTQRHGTAVFPSREGLYRYLAVKEADVEDSVVVELEGPVSEDLDLDADEGALLIHPRRIVGIEPLDADLVRSIRARVDGENAGATSG